MKLKAEELIVLDDNKKYIISSELEYNNCHYLLLAGVLEDESNINNEFLLAKEVVSGEDSYIEDVTDPNLIAEILPLFELKEED